MKRRIRTTTRLLAGALLTSALTIAGAIGGGSRVASAGTNYACGQILANDDGALQSAYATWKANYVTSQGAGGHLRVRRPASWDGNDTVSEGVAYGMIFAAYLNDQSTFNGLWNYAKSHFNGNGVMNWRIDANNNTTGFNGASDAEEDMAFALIVADKKWGGYGADARSMINKIYQFEVESGTAVFKPGDAFGGSNETNPSYFDPGMYKVFKAYENNARWDAVVNKSYEILNNVNNNNTGLQPDWVNASGQPGSRGVNYTYDAARVPMRLVRDWGWFCDARAKAELDQLNGFFSGVGMSNIKDGYALNGGVIGGNHNGAFVGPVAAGATASGNAGFRQAAWNELIGIGTDGFYYSDSLRLLSILWATGNMYNPMAGGGGGGGNPTPTPVPSNPTATPVPSNPTPTPVPAAGACQITYIVRNQWNVGFTADVIVKNTSASALNGWNVTWSFPNGQAVTQIWNASHSQNGVNVSVLNAGWNGSIAPGASTQFGFNGSQTGTNNRPTNFRVNGQVCSVL
jgi:endo-1,4-beta-D-glucanase Y